MAQLNKSWEQEAELWVIEIIFLKLESRTFPSGQNFRSPQYAHLFSNGLNLLGKIQLLASGLYVPKLCIDLDAGVNHGFHSLTDMDRFS